MADKIEYRGMGFLPLLAILFIGLKLAGVIAWSWWWVLSPLWIPAAILLSLGAIFLGLYLWLGDR